MAPCRYWDNSTASWGGSTEAIQPTGTLGDGRDAPLRMALARGMGMSGAKYRILSNAVVPLRGSDCSVLGKNGLHVAMTL